MTDKIVPVIMAGGKGTRLWPLSRSSAPKQFIRLTSDQSLFQATLARISDNSRYEAPVVVTNEDFRFLVAEQARELDIALSGILLEPSARNTAPAIAAAAAFVSRRFGEDATLMVLASDHEITADRSYIAAVETGFQTTKAGKLVTFGITPTEPATGYGYIEAGEDLAEGAKVVRRFVEKPDLARAEAMLKSGDFLWNSGIFMFGAGQLISEMQRHAPKVTEAAEASVATARSDLDFIRLDAAEFEKAPDISIDYAIMEKTTNAAVVLSCFSWSDMGSWDAVWKLGKPDDDGNVAIGNTTVVGTRNSLIVSNNSHLAVQGLDGVAVIASEDAVYVGRLDDSQSVGALVKRLAATDATAGLTQTHPTAYRPWGGYTSILNGERFQVKRLFVTPGKKLSLQKHHHRSEHWVCVKGTAEVTLGTKTLTLRENESVYIPQGELHRLANPGKITLEIIEVQTGSYLGEDDIIRVDDEFGRG